MSGVAKVLREGEVTDLGEVFMESNCASSGRQKWNPYGDASKARERLRLDT